jgi:hypothetical protein
LVIKKLKGRSVVGSLFYKDHAIVITGRPAGSADDPVGYVPVAVISWNRPDVRRRVMQVLKSEKLCDTPEQASAVALEQAKAWVERHRVKR